MLISLRLYECGRKLHLYTKTRSRRIELSTLDNRFVSGELSGYIIDRPSDYRVVNSVCTDNERRIVLSFQAIDYR